MYLPFYIESNPLFMSIFFVHVSHFISQVIRGRNLFPMNLMKESEIYFGDGKYPKFSDKIS